ncbi:hypothetical protein DVA67_033705 [Solirubrobacter sp. CPCC 204708]|uniref:calcium-binding protein n=1 Tax=Solirubrobacter deserti TaxID=2282478 RepID=UPI001930A492|nr:hypothetical protein [Solirubrobacter deserti]MBE2320962.1 hypothetical protein [Solirubrobacter deserti]
MRFSRSLAGALGALAILAPPAAAADITFDGRTLVVRDAEEAGLVLRGARLEVDFGRDGDPEFLVPRSRFDSVRVNDVGTLALEGGRFELAAVDETVRVSGKFEAELDRVGIVRIAGTDASDVLSVGDLSATDTFQVAAALGAGADRITIAGGEDDDQISIGAFGVLGPTYVTFEGAEVADRLVVDGAAGDDIVSASVATMTLTLAGGSGDNTLLGGPGDDTLLGGDGFDDVRGGAGHDVAKLGGNFDRFSWRSGDGSDVVDGGESRDSLFFEGSNASEASVLKADGRALRLTHSTGSTVMALTNLEEVDAVLGGGADTFSVGDLRRTPTQLVDVSLAPLPITAGGDGQPDRVTVDATPDHDALTLTGQIVVAGTATLTGLAHTVNVSHAEAADTLAIDTLAGQDTVDTSGLQAGTIGVQVFD